jgi:hypothetical protein
MNKTLLAVLAVAGLAVACAPASNIPASSGAAPTNQQAQQQLPPGHAPVAGMAPAPAAPATKAPIAGIAKADKTVAEIYAGKDGFGDTVVNVRGKVVKYSAQIMGKNWIHLQDGTGTAGSNDLMVTSADTARTGDVVLVTGKVTLNKDFGSGYFYPVILDNAKVAVEK